ncbi:MAG TPA: SoxR reducing system RseC family protein [Bacteroidales bacterium]|nr:RseC/MucC family positive regulator of sigma(E) [Bacteroidota bacterium]HJN05960.1 SoxR reducing system RseC family protein [Bacteroidales bacterium]
MRNKIVTHPGIIKKITGNNIEIAIMVTSGCSSCEIKGACAVSDVEEKSVSVNTDSADQYTIGQEITIEMKQSLGTWAVLLGYVFPFIVLFTGLIIFINVGLDQGLAGILALSLLLPYYLTLYLLRNFLSSRFNYNIRQ